VLRSCGAQVYKNFKEGKHRILVATDLVCAQQLQLLPRSPQRWAVQR
jgi:hypothetical protein